MIRFFHILYCKSRMVAYVNGELSPKLRSRMAQYIEHYPECYVEYRRQQDLRRELASSIPMMGIPQKGQLQRLWRVIEGEVAKPATLILSLPQIMTYSVASVALVWMVIVMTTLYPSDGTTLVITPPTPDNSVLAVKTSNPNRTAQPVAPTFVAIATSDGFMVATEARPAQIPNNSSNQNPYPTPRLGE